VAITPAAGYVHVYSSLVFGFTAAAIVFILVHVKVFFFNGRWFLKYFDDSLDVFLCHGFSGALGAFLVGFFASSEVNPAVVDEGVLFGGGKLLGYQIVTIIITMALSSIGTAVILLFLRFTIGIHYTEEEERMGIDVVAHRQVAYLLAEEDEEDNEGADIEMVNVENGKGVEKRREQKTGSRNLVDWYLMEKVDRAIGRGVDKALKRKEPDEEGKKKKREDNEKDDTNSNSEDTSSYSGPLRPEMIRRDSKIADAPKAAEGAHLYGGRFGEKPFDA
jgi:hypothetical protein